MKPWNNPPPPINENAAQVSTIGAINQLPDPEQRAIYARMIPRALLKNYKINPYMVDSLGRDLLKIEHLPNSTSVEISLYHQYQFPDPLLYGQISDTINGQVHILFYVLSDPNSPRFMVDRLPDGTLTQLGTQTRNIQAEILAMRAGLSPGQIRQGPHLLRAAMTTFEEFIQSLNHDLHFAEPLFYHNAVIFERFGFAYQKGRRLMERIQQGFGPQGDLLPLLDGSNPFRQPEAAHSIRLRSWAIHDGILGEQFQNVTMYKKINHPANISTCEEIRW
ncbi:MAG TPA: hypothetical protein DEH25_09625 [Chloroflexi bacterium]|nr:hypothetical protein [Chloroflexota bacterium]HBY06471.1 hypothetical protein [Chloroflexota bacterium]